MTGLNLRTRRILAQPEDDYPRQKRAWQGVHCMHDELNCAKASLLKRGAVCNPLSHWISYCKECPYSSGFSLSDTSATIDSAHPSTFVGCLRNESGTLQRCADDDRGSTSVVYSPSTLPAGPYQQTKLSYQRPQPMCVLLPQTICV